MPVEALLKTIARISVRADDSCRSSSSRCTASCLLPRSILKARIHWSASCRPNPSASAAAASKTASRGRKAAASLTSFSLNLNAGGDKYLTWRNNRQQRDEGLKEGVPKADGRPRRHSLPPSRDLNLRLRVRNKSEVPQRASSPRRGRPQPPARPPVRCAPPPQCAPPPSPKDLLAPSF